MGIRFYSGEEKYDYYFVVNADINSSSYVEKPTKLSEALLNNSRDYTASQEGWNFMKLTVTESMLSSSKNVRAYMAEVLPISPRFASAMMNWSG